MSTMYGADVAQLRTLASQFDRLATQLDSDRMSVGNAIQISAWVGPVAVRFRQTWESDHSRRLHGAASRLRAAAGSLRANADDQERTSAAGSGSGGGSGIKGGPAHSPSPTHPSFDPSPLRQFLRAAASAPDQVVDWMANVNSTVDALGTLSNLYGLSIKTPGVTGALGVMFDVANTVRDIGQGNGIGAALNATSSGAGVASIVAKSFGPLALGVSVGKTFVDWTLPYTAQSQDETYNKGVQLLYGRSVDPSSLTPEQAEGMRRRYDGALGVANMISDRMNATADKIFPWNRRR